MTVKIGIIGAGLVARVHMHAYLANPRAQVVAIADVDPDARSCLAWQGNLERSFADYHELLNVRDLDAVDICLPHYLHHEVVLAALERGIDVICEKPIAMTLAEADEMIASADRAGRQLLIVLNQRFLPFHLRAKELLEAGVIGRPFLAIGRILGSELPRMADPDHWKGTWDRAGGGALADTGTHLIDIFNHLFGPVEAVSAVAKRLVVEAPNKGDDNAAVSLEFKSGVLASLIISYSVTSRPWSEKKDIYGTEGSLHLCNESSAPLQLARDGQLEPIRVAHDPEWWPYSITRCLNHFIKCLTGDDKPAVTPRDAREALRIALLAYKAWREGRTIQEERT